MPVFLLVASIFLTKLVKLSLTSRAKTTATGLLPYAQTRHCFLPAKGPVTLSGSNGVGCSPTCRPDLRGSWATAPAVASAITAKAPTTKQFRIVALLCLDDHSVRPLFVYHS